MESQEAQTLCPRCDSLDLDKIFAGNYETPQIVTRLGDVPHDMLSSECPLCRLLAEAVHRPFSDESLTSYHDTCDLLCNHANADPFVHGYFLFADRVNGSKWEGIGHSDYARYLNFVLNGAMHNEGLFLKSDASNANTVMALANDECPLTTADVDIPDEGFIALKVGRLKGEKSGVASYLGSIYPVSSSESKTGAGRLVLPTINWDLLRSFVRTCQDSHEVCRSAKEELSIAGFCLINCITRSLEPATAEASYVALSYVWGQPDKSNDFQASLGLSDGLPRMPLVIEDAMAAVREIGLVYLWVDRYCIKQDDCEILSDHLSKMHVIYRQAIFTIIAAAGGDSVFGLPGVSIRRRQTQAHANVGGRLLVSALEPFKNTSKSIKWNTRAWTYQEGVFSIRQLIFDAHQVTFRDLTFESDALNAITNTLNDYKDRTKDAAFHAWGMPFAANLNVLDGSSPGPLSHVTFASENAIFGFSLAWYSASTDLRRRHGFPTWSWSSCRANVGFLDVPDRNSNNVLMPDPEIDARLEYCDGQIVSLSEYKSQDSSVELSRYLHLEAWSVRSGLTFHPDEGRVTIDVGDDKYHLTGKIGLETLPDDKDQKPIHDLMMAKDGWEAVVVFYLPEDYQCAVQPFIITLMRVDDPEKPNEEVYERIGHIQGLRLEKKSKRRAESYQAPEEDVLDREEIRNPDTMTSGRKVEVQVSQKEDTEDLDDGSDSTDTVSSSDADSDDYGDYTINMVCDGSRPKCQHCTKRNVECHYEANQGETVSLALKRKANVLENENAQYRDLFRMVCSKTEDEAQEIFRRIRVSGDPLKVLESIRQAEILLPSPAANERVSDSRLAKLNDKAMENSLIRVPAKPWTAIADDGLVSELITDFFSWENASAFPAVDRDLFVADMRAANVKKAKYCSPILVNAICALRSPFVERAKQFGAITGQDLAKRFRDEVMQLVEKSQGRATLPTIIALVLIDWSASIAGDEPTAKMYRYMAWERYKRFRPERRFSQLQENDPQERSERLAISKAVWAIFFMESRISYFYHQVSYIPPPPIPKLFDNNGADALENRGNLDVLGRPYLGSTTQIPLVPGIATINSNIACLQYEIMQYITSGDNIKGSAEDLKRRKSLYCKLQQFRADLPKRFRMEFNFTPSTAFLRMHENEIAYVLLTSLHPSTKFDTPFTDTATTVKSLTLQHCLSDTTLAEAYLQKYTVSSYTTRQLFVTMQALIPFLNDGHAATNDLFTRLCMMGGLTARVVRMTVHLLQAAQAMAWAMKQDIPEAAKPYLEPWVKLAIQESETTKPPSYSVPDRDEIKELLAESDRAVAGPNEGSGAELWALVEKWVLSGGSK
ncbi:Nitrogen assimilation transcription factor nit-4 [Colletotrichum siamense]|uniref:Nitrogen assimilation transcription factor nit-4 n=1 Tax=Colletotrichum siamense TaxID=690259 RepID=A0A9P5BUU1_COLSI|nr:Nitrogen assimilation transcription factor nit-4 [Colletotrichum siamense]KAF4848907.1 Nitrogen assimilation transcription factor nit-4 [Colletotrichum siamense]